MKKFLATVLCLMLLISAIALPVSVSASDANESVFDPEKTMWYSIDYVRTESANAIDDAYVYTWTPEADGIMKFSVDTECTDVCVVVENTSNSSDNGVTFNYYPDGGYASIDDVEYRVKGGNTYKVSVMTCSGKSGTADFFVYYNAQSEDGLMGAGTADSPYVIDSTVTSLPTISTGKTVYFSMVVNETLKYDLTVKGNNAKDSFELYVESSKTTEKSSGGSATVEAIIPIMASESIIFAITNTGKTIGGPYTYNLVENTTASTVGTYEDPAELVLDTLTTVNVVGAYYFAYTATEDGILSVDLKETESWACAITGGKSESAYCLSTNDPVVNPVEYAVFAGEEITVWVATSEFGAGTVSFEATLKVEGEDTTQNTTEDSTGEGSENTTQSTTTAAPEFELGDVNLDGTVNIKDATAIQKHIAGLIAFDDSELALADFDLNGSINVKDATAIQKMLAGLAW